MNVTALNQADHCIVARPNPSALGNPLPTIAQPNQVVDAVFCHRLFGGTGFAPLLSSAFAAQADLLGGELRAEAFTGAEVADLTRAKTATAIQQVQMTQVATTRAVQVEAQRLALKRGADNPVAIALAAQANAGVANARLLATGSEAMPVTPPSTPAGGSTFSGRVANDRGIGLP